jgi:hypothetical protein
MVLLTTSHFWTYGFTNAHKSNPAVANMKMKTTSSSLRESRSVGILSCQHSSEYSSNRPEQESNGAMKTSSA